MNIEQIKERLESFFPGSQINITDESSKHRHHAGAVGAGEVSHIVLNIKSSQFKGLNMVKKHQLIYSCFTQEMKSGELHSVSIESAEE